jgi:hypothetical protein
MRLRLCEGLVEALLALRGDVLFRTCLFDGSRSGSSFLEMPAGDPGPGGNADQHEGLLHSPLRNDEILLLLDCEHLDTPARIQIGCQ